MSTTEPVAPPPTRNRRKPAEATPDVTASAGTRPVPSTEVTPSRHDPLGALHVAAADNLADMLTGTAQYPNTPEAPARSPYAAFMGLGRPVDPDNDLAAGPNRYPKYVLAAMTLIKNSTGKPLQQIVAEAVIGKTPIPDVVLDEAFRALYGYDRPPVR